jgi:hypothetical protein
LFSCSYPFNYSPAGHVITGDVDIVESEDLKSLIRKVPKLREPQSFRLLQNFVSIMNAVEYYVKGWDKREKKELDTFSQWVKSIRRILNFQKLILKHELFILLCLVNQEVMNEFERLNEENVLVLVHKSGNNIVFV